MADRTSKRIREAALDLLATMRAHAALSDRKRAVCWVVAVHDDESCVVSVYGPYLNEADAKADEVKMGREINKGADHFGWTVKALPMLPVDD